MRKRTVFSQLHLSNLSAESKIDVYNAMLGFSDESTKLNSRHNSVWHKAVTQAFKNRSTTK